MKSVPVTDRGRASTERILDTACELFYVQGIRATELDQIAKASKTGKGQIYHFFDGKSDLVLAVVDRQADRILSAQQPYLSDMRTVADVVAWADFLVRAHTTGSGQLRCPLGALAAEFTDGRPLQAALEAAFGRWRKVIADGLARVLDSGDLPAESDVDTQAELLLGAYQGGVVLSRIQHDSGPLRRMLEAALGQVLGRTITLDEAGART